MRFQPQRAGGEGRINFTSLPPRRLIGAAVGLTMMSSAQRYGELVTDFAAERPALGEAKMMGIGRPATADQARLLRHISDVVSIADPARLRKSQLALVYGSCLRPPLTFPRAWRWSGLRQRGRCGLASHSKACQPFPKCRFDAVGIGSCQFVLFRK